MEVSWKYYRIDTSSNNDDRGFVGKIHFDGAVLGVPQWANRPPLCFTPAGTLMLLASKTTTDKFNLHIEARLVTLCSNSLSSKTH